MNILIHMKYIVSKVKNWEDKDSVDQEVNPMQSVMN